MHDTVKLFLGVWEAAFGGLLGGLLKPLRIVVC